MRFVKPSSIMLVIVKGREGNADVANKAYLRSDLAKKWGDVSTIRGGRCRSKDVRKSKAIVGIEKWAGFAMHLLVDAEECRAEIVSFGPKLLRGRSDGVASAQHRGDDCKICIFVRSGSCLWVHGLVPSIFRPVYCPSLAQSGLKNMKSASRDLMSTSIILMILAGHAMPVFQIEAPHDQRREGNLTISISCSATS
jgi:hypothetical protein